MRTKIRRLAARIRALMPVLIVPNRRFLSRFFARCAFTAPE